MQEIINLLENIVQAQTLDYIDFDKLLELIQKHFPEEHNLYKQTTTLLEASLLYSQQKAYFYSQIKDYQQCLQSYLDKLNNLLEE